MNKTILYTFAIILLILWTVAEYLVGGFIEVRSFEKSKHYQELVRLSKVQDQKSLIQKTLAVAYPQLSIFEVRAYGEIFYMFTEELYKVPFVKPAAIINHESGWNPTLISWAKCRGLGGLSTSAAIDGCKKYHIRYHEGFTEWYDVVNLALSLEYFCSRYEAKGDSFATRAYIGGDTWKGAKQGSNRRAYITSYSDSVEAASARIDSVFNEIKTLDYIRKGVLYHD